MRVKRDEWKDTSGRRLEREGCGWRSRKAKGRRLGLASGGGEYEEDRARQEGGV